MTDAYGSHEPPSEEAVRSSALSLLASGNSIESVAHVLGVPVDTLQSWAAHPAQPLPPPLPAQAPAVTAPAPSWNNFPRTATFAMGAMGRYAAFSLVPLLLAGPVFAWPFVFDGSNGTSGTFIFFVATLACVAAAACAVRYVTHARFVLQPHAITVYLLGDGVSLPLARIEALTATRQFRSRSYTVALHPKAGAPSLTIYPEDRHLLDDDLFAWLTAIPRRGGDVFRRPDPDASSSGLGPVFTVVACALALASVCFLASGPIDTARALLTGYPPLEQLNLVEGSVTRIGRCTRAGRSATYLPVTLLTDAGPQDESLDCSLATALRAGPRPHHLAVWRDTRRFADGRVREVVMDGQVLQSYADYIARSRRVSPSFLLGQLMLLSTILLFGYAIFASSRED